MILAYSRQSMDILDQEAYENEALLAKQPHLSATTQPSHIANSHLIAAARQYEETSRQAGNSDASVRAKWEEWQPMIEILAGGQVSRGMQLHC